MQYALMETQEPREVIEPEVLPPQDGGSDRKGRPRSGTAASVRWVRVVPALLSGLILDAADLFTRMPLIPHGAILGTLVGIYVCRTQAIPMQQRPWWIAACAVYCAMPLTEFYPLATLFLLYRALSRP